MIKINLVILFLLFLVFGVYWNIFSPGPKVANDFSLISQQLLVSQFDLPQTWSIRGTEGLGEYAVFTLWSWPFNFLNGLLANLGLSFEVLERVLMIIPFLFISILSIWKFCTHLKFSNNAKFISSIFYLTNTYVLLLIDGGQITIGLAYALFPLAFLVIEQSLAGGFKRRIQAAILVSILGVFDFRFIFVLVLLCLIRFIYGFSGVDWLKSWIKTTVTILLIYIGLNFYWLLVLLKAPLSTSTFASLTQTTFISFISLGHAFLLFSPHWFKNVFGNVSPLGFEFFLIPLLVFLAPILKPKNKIVGFWLIVALISIFLTKGSSEPFSNIYPWLHSYMPGFSLFRDSSKFFFLVGLAYSILLGVTVDEMIKRFRKYRFLIAGTITVYLISLINPVWTLQMTGTFSEQPLQKEYSNLSTLFANDSNPSKIFWIPTISPLTALNVKHPSVEAARFAQRRPFNSSVVGEYEVFNFLRAPYMGQLFDVAGIGYIAYPPLDTRRADLKSDNVNYYNTFLNQLSKLSWLSRIDNSKIPILQVKQHQNELFITPNVWYVLGSDDIYKEATTSSKLALAKNALIFAEEFPELGKRVDELPQARIVLNHKTTLDLAASFLSKSNIIFPANKLKHDPDASGWWKRETSDLINWKDFLKTKYGINNQDFDLGGGWAVAEGNLELKIQYPKITRNKILLARVLESTESGQISFYEGENLIGQVNTKSPGDNVRWFEVGGLTNGGEFSIKTQGSINVVNAMAVVDKTLWQEYKNKALGYKDQIVDFGKGVQEASASVSYKQINSTKYIVTVQNLKQPSFLVFSQNFDNNWKLDGQLPLPVYSFLNGYSIRSDGQYELNFELQKYVPFGLIISAVTLLTAIFLLLV